MYRLTRKLFSLREVVRVVVVVILVTASGCSAIGSSSSGSAELPSEAEATERYASLDTVNATVTTVRTRNDKTTTIVTQKRERVRSFAYFERVISVTKTKETRPPRVGEGGFIIANGSRLVSYDPESNELHRMSFQTTDSATETTYPELLAAAKSNRPVSQPTSTPGISPLPVVPREDESGENSSAAYRGGNVTVVYNGTETIAGRETYRLEIAPANEDMSLRSQTLWLDTEFLFPIKRQTSFVANGDDYEYLVTYRNVTFNPTFEPGTFQLDPQEVPDDAQQVQFNTYESRAALADAASLPVPNPNMPAEFELDVASHRSTDPEVAMLRYESTSTDTHYRIGILNGTRNTTTGTPVQVGEYEARQTQTNRTVRISWSVNRTTYYVSRFPADTADDSTLLRVARSVARTT
ncbi:hypothetical protein [Haloarcula sp. Atlit-120R]|uniref:LolA family protein n=1 Tax=Haloarcula sp. Atlit-120R TaxID=2282135 RepID=UPI0018F3E4AA|nr:hypothetical protein [Haloarcula sp. Atlit-120R]